jgi:hypothetical protein
MQEAGKAVGEGGFTDIINELKQAIIRITEDGTLTRWAEGVAGAFKSIVAQIRQMINTFDEVKRSRAASDQAAREILGEKGEGIFGSRRAAKAPEIRKRAAEIFAEGQAKINAKKEAELIAKINKRLEAKKLKAADEQAAEQLKIIKEQGLLDKAAGFTVDDDGPKPWQFGRGFAKPTDVDGETKDVKDTGRKTGVEAIAEKITEVSAPLDSPATSINESTLSLFNKLSEGRSFEGATAALGEVQTAAEGETIKLVATLLEEQNKILNDRLGGVTN